MEIEVKVNLKPFIVPTYVLTEDETIGKYAIGDLPPEALKQLCDDFTKRVFKKAGKPMPTGSV